MTPAFADTPEIAVTTSAELIRALETQGARTVRLRAGRYALDAPLHVPDGVALVGEGIMRRDADGLPDGFTAGTATMLVASEWLRGDVVALGDGARLERLRIEGPPAGIPHNDSPAANVVVVASRRPGDRVRTVLRECEIVNHSNAGVGLIGPTGRAIAVVTVNPGGGAPVHDGSLVSARIERSAVRNTASSASVFAINFASAATIDLDVEGNRLEGIFGAAGGVGRPHRVSGSRVVVRSRGNLYVYSAGSLSLGWALIGASASPHAEITGAQGAESSSVRVESQDDRIEGYRIGIRAAAGRLVKDLPGSVVGNRVELMLDRLALRTVGEDAVDLSLHGALYMQDLEILEPEASPRLEDNVLRVNIRNSSGSGPRKNLYAHSALSGAADVAHRNRLEITGSRAEFLEFNTGFDPAPGPGHFVVSAAAR